MRAVSVSATQGDQPSEIAGRVWPIGLKAPADPVDLGEPLVRGRPCERPPDAGAVAGPPAGWCRSRAP